MSRVPRVIRSLTWILVLVGVLQAGRVGLTLLSNWRQRDLAVQTIAELAESGRRIGSATAPLKLVVFSNFSCGYCAQLADTLKLLQSKYPAELTIVYRNYLPVQVKSQEQMHLAAECAGDQGKFEEYATLAFRSSSLQRQRGGWQLIGRLAEIPDTTAFAACVANKQHLDRIQQDTKIAYSLGVDGTPTSFLNGSRIVGLRTFRELDSLFLVKRSEGR